MEEVIKTRISELVINYICTYVIIIIASDVKVQS